MTEIIRMNPYTDKDSPRDKQSICDIQAKTSEGKLINIETVRPERCTNHVVRTHPPQIAG